MSEYYTRQEICKMFNPPVSKYYLKMLESNRIMPLSVKRISNGYIYDKKQIDDWLSQEVEKDKFGMKKGDKQARMGKEHYDIWNIRKNKERIVYSDEYTDVIRFLQPSLKNRFICDEL